jgi:hypothetical protein
MEAKYSSETLVHFQGTTWSYIPEDRALSSIKFFLKNVGGEGRGLF